MAETNFASLFPEQKLVWGRDVWSAARDRMFLKKFTGKDDNNVVQRITELTETEKGTRAIMHLVADLVEDGVIGDNEREGNEEALQSYHQIIQTDLITHGIKEKGKLANQRSVISARKLGRNRLTYWLSNRCDQLGLLTLSGVSYAFKNNGAPRTGSPFPSLEFAADVSAPTSNRIRNWTGSSLEAANTGSITSSYVANYEMVVDACAYAKDHYIKPLMGADGREYYVMFVSPRTLAQLKKDDNYQRAVTSGGPRDVKKNPWFTGGSVTIDGAVIHEHRLVYNTAGAASGSKWGAGGAVEGTRTLLCGAQALGMADIGTPDWVEKLFDYDSKWGINVDKIFGLLKPVFYSIYDESSEDFGVLAINHYLG